MEVRIPRRAEYSKEFSSLLHEVACDPKFPFRPSSHYALVGDLRPFGRDAILHAHCKHGDGDHKLELLETGGKGISQMLGEIESVFAGDPLDAEVMRVDCTADVAVPVHWFQQRLRVKAKQFANQIDKVFSASASEPLEIQQMGKRGVETLYYGKRPNMFRIYNKTAERWNDYQRVLRARDRSIDIPCFTEAQQMLPEEFWRRVYDAKDEAELAPVPSFEELYGFPASETRTRIERQMGAGRVPPKLATMRAMRMCAMDFNPFDPLEILQGHPDPDPALYRVSDYLCGLGLREIVERMGMTQARKWVNARSTRNVERMFKKYQAFFPPEVPEGVSERWDGTLEQVTVERLYDVYRGSVGRQLAA